jgi:hypothetical protein
LTNKKAEPKRVNFSWKDHEDRKAQALAMLKSLGNSASDCQRAVEKLQADEVLNADGLFDNLSRRTLRHWYDKQQNLLLGDGAEDKRKTGQGRHMACPIAEDVLLQLQKILDGMGEAGVTLNSTSIRAPWSTMIHQLQPGVLACDPQKPGGTFKMSPSWINQKCRQWNYTMQRKTTTSNHLPENWEALGEMMALRLAYYVDSFKIPKELVVGVDETPVKTTPNADSKTRAKANSGDVPGVGKDNKLQVRAKFLLLLFLLFLLLQGSRVVVFVVFVAAREQGCCCCCCCCCCKGAGFFRKQGCCLLSCR